MNILYLDATRSLYGASRMLLTLLENLDRRQVTPYVVMANDVEDDLRLCRELDRLGVPYLEHPIAVLRRRKYLNPSGALLLSGTLFRSVRSLTRLIRHYKIDLVQTNTSTVLSGAVAARRAGVPHVWHVHELFRRWEGPVLARLLWALSRCVVAPSEAIADNLIKALPTLEQKLVIIKNGVDPQPFRTVPANRVDRLRAEWGIAPGDKVVGMIGRIGMWKGEGQFVGLARLVAQRYRGATFVIVGGVFDDEQRHIAALERLIETNMPAGRVVVAGLREDIPTVVNLFDVLVHLPERPEPFGLVAIEAMAAGKPVVAAALGGLTEIVRDGEMGYLVPPGDIEVAAKRVTALLEDDALRARLGKAGSARVDALFSSAAYAARFEALYRNLAGHEPDAGEAAG